MAAPKKILLVQLYSNGDCLYATAIARQIKTDFPGCRLTWAIADFCKTIIDNNPYVDDAMVIENLLKSDVVVFRKLKRAMAKLRDDGTFDEIFITQNMDTNQAFYDGCIRSNIFRAYPNPITVPVTPVLRLSDTEIQCAASFATQHRLQRYKQVVLFEFAPQSGQSKFSNEFALTVAEGIVEKGNTAIILSSGNAISHSHPAIIDGSSLTLRETAALTHHCSLLLGCSSGITWISTSDAAKPLPMVQLLNAQTKWVNPVSRDFQRFNLPADNVIELIEFNEKKAIDCVNAALQNFRSAKNNFNQLIPLHFKTTHSIVYNLLCYLEFGAIQKHIWVNRQVYGNKFSFYAAVISGFIVFPFKLIKNFINKRLIGK